MLISVLACASMLRKHEVLQAISDTGALLIIRLDSADEALSAARAAVAGESAPSRSHSPSRTRSGHPHVGRRVRRAGRRGRSRTVLERAGRLRRHHRRAQLLVSPNLNPNMIRLANRYQVATISGAFTPTEFVQTLERRRHRQALSHRDRRPRLPAHGARAATTGAGAARRRSDHCERRVTGSPLGPSPSASAQPSRRAARPTGDASLITRAAADFLAAIRAARG